MKDLAEQILISNAKSAIAQYIDEHMDYTMEDYEKADKDQKENIVFGFLDCARYYKELYELELRNSKHNK